MFLLSLGCAAVPHPEGRQASADLHNHAAAENPGCKTRATADIGCSGTVTAVFDAQGRLWIAWVGQERIYIQSSADKGRTFSDPVPVNAKAEPIIAHDEYRPKIRVDGQGNIYVAWTRSLEKNHTGHIRFSRSADGGKTFSEPVTINDNLDIISHRFDALAVGANGEVFIAWLDARDKEIAKAASREFAGTSVYYTWSDNGGQSFHANKPVAAHSCECCRLGVAIDNDNLPVLLWRAVLDGGIRDHALVKFNAWDAPGDWRRASDEHWKIEACPHHGPDLSISDSGVYHAVWFSGGGDRQGLFYANSADAGLGFSSPFRFGGQTAKHPSVFSAGRQVAIVWQEFDGANNVLRLIRSVDGGKTWTEPEQIGATPDQADYGFLLGDGERIYLSWQTRQGYEFKAIDE